MGNSESQFISVIILQVIIVLLFLGILAMLFMQDSKLNKIIKSVKEAIDSNKPK